MGLTTSRHYTALASKHTASYRGLCAEGGLESQHMIQRRGMVVSLGRLLAGLQALHLAMGAPGRLVSQALLQVLQSLQAIYPS